MKSTHSWIVAFWAGVFELFAFASLFNLIRSIVPRIRGSHSFVEYYVTLNTAVALLALIISAYRRDVEATTLLAIAAIFGAYRIYEITAYQVNVLLFDEYRSKKAGVEYYVRGYRRLVILLLHNYLEIVCWFGVSYMYFFRSGDITIPDGGVDPTFFWVFRESLLLMFSFDPDHYEAATDVGVAIFSIQAVIGLFMTLMVLARFLAILPPPKTADEFEREDVEKPHTPK